MTYCGRQLQSMLEGQYPSKNPVSLSTHVCHSGMWMDVGQAQPRVEMSKGQLVNFA